jgi:hypothetical protein
LTYTAYGIWALSALYVIVVLCITTNIRVSIAVLKASASFLTDNLSAVFVPVYALIFFLIFLTYWVVSALFLFSVGAVTTTSEEGM